MDKISLYKNIITESDAKLFIQLRKTYPPTGDVVIENKDIIKDLDQVLKPYVHEFLNDNIFKNKLLPLDSVMLLEQTEKEDPDTLHFDEQVTNNGKLIIAPLVCLIYLTASGIDFENGQLYFPFQKRIIEPEVGDLVIFPTGYLYPHKAMPFSGGNRYLIKLFYRIETNLSKYDEENLYNRITGELYAKV
jgi:hypothetical protein